MPGLGAPTEDRTDRELIFPWPYNWNYFHKIFHRLQNAAGIPRVEHFGLHNIRKAMATILWEIRPRRPNLHWDTQDQATTAKHYVQSAAIVAQALDKLPQPWTEAAGGTA